MTGEILKQKDVTKILATADILARGIINHLQICGKKIPEEYSVIGFNDTYQSKNMYPGITTVGQNVLDRGEMPGKMILKIINHEPIEKENIRKWGMPQHYPGFYLQSL